MINEYRKEDLQVHDRSAQKKIKKSSKKVPLVCVVSRRKGDPVSRRKNLVVVFAGVVIILCLTFFALAFAYPRESTAPLTSPVFA